MRGNGKAKAGEVKVAATKRRTKKKVEPCTVCGSPGYARSLCHAHYATSLKLVQSGKVSWERLEEKGVGKASKKGRHLGEIERMVWGEGYALEVKVKATKGGAGGAERAGRGKSAPTPAPKPRPRPRSKPKAAKTAKSATRPAAGVKSKPGKPRKAAKATRTTKALRALGEVRTVKARPQALDLEALEGQRGVAPGFESAGEGDL